MFRAGLDNNKRKSAKKSGRLGCILHFLRGGGAIHAHRGLTHENGKPVERIFEVFGFVNRKVSEKILAMILRKMIDKVCGSSSVALALSPPASVQSH